ncbi:hypothetical protein [Virgibacillus sp. CBA3643]|uniref:hypothetical protein n=1 Tax=Virgibacillus sp. CBA3643 TaxID=2942278 RepID=UPI0035A35534
MKLPRFISTGKPKNQPESRRINRKAEESTGKPKNQPESRRINRKAEESTGKPKNQPESRRINRTVDFTSWFISFMPKTTTFRR